MRISLPNPVTTGLLVLAVFGLISCNKPEKKPEPEAIRPIKLLTLEGSSSGMERKFPGVVRATNRVDLSFQVSGTLVELPAKEGLQVKKGDLLARLDTRDFVANLDNAKGTVAKAQAALEYAITEDKRYTNIKAVDAGAVSDSTVSLKHRMVLVAKADVQSAQAGLAVAQNQLGYTELRAPFTGVVAQRHTDNFQEVNAKQAIVSLQNLAAIDIMVDIPEALMASVRKSSLSLFAEFAAAPDRRFDLKIKEIALQADARTQTFRVILTMPAPSGVRILSGMTANVHLENDVALADPSASSFLIPTSALWADEAGHSMVWLVDKKTMSVHRQAITTTELSGSDQIRVTSGLQADQTIAISGVSKLHDGQIVRAMSN